MRTQLVFALSSFAVFTAIACGSGDVTLGNNEYSIQKTASGGRTGDGQHCFWTSADQYNLGDSVPSPDKCNTCRCTALGIACTTKPCADAGARSCVYGGKDYAVGSSFLSSDGCNTCNCTQGGVSCTEKACVLTCKWGDKVYHPGESFGDACTACACNAAGQTTCTAKACPLCVYNGVTYKIGDSYPAGDTCNTCSCQVDGTSTCTTKLCPGP